VTNDNLTEDDSASSGSSYDIWKQVMTQTSQLNIVY
jgi:hypothetical protein